jgi:ABC-type phosphate transport system permease subunit
VRWVQGAAIAAADRAGSTPFRADMSTLSHTVANPRPLFYGALDRKCGSWTYLLVKTLHIISATILFGMGIGIANFMFLGHFSSDRVARSFATRMTVRADFLFTLPAVIV